MAAMAATATGPTPAAIAAAAWGRNTRNDHLASRTRPALAPTSAHPATSAVSAGSGLAEHRQHAFHGSEGQLGQLGHAAVAAVSAIAAIFSTRSGDAVEVRTCYEPIRQEAWAQDRAPQHGRHPVPPRLAARPVHPVRSIVLALAGVHRKWRGQDGDSCARRGDHALTEQRQHIAAHNQFGPFLQNQRVYVQQNVEILHRMQIPAIAANAHVPGLTSGDHLVPDAEQLGIKGQVGTEATPIVGVAVRAGEEDRLHQVVAPLTEPAAHCNGGMEEAVLAPGPLLGCGMGDEVAEAGDVRKLSMLDHLFARI